MNNGFVVLHRKFLKWEWSQDPNMVSLFIYLLLSANHEDGRWKGVEVKRGQHITGLHKLSLNTGISHRSLRTCLERLETTGELTSKTTNRFRILTIVKYSEYQDKKDKTTSKTTSKLTSYRQTNDKQTTTNNNDNNENNENKYKQVIVGEQSSQVQEVFKVFYEINPTIKFGNTTQRSAAERLIKKLGAEKTIASAKAAIAIYGQQFAPTITTPLQLEDKLAQLVAYYRKQENSSKFFTI